MIVEVKTCRCPNCGSLAQTENAGFGSLCVAAPGRWSLITLATAVKRAVANCGSVSMKPTRGAPATVTSGKPIKRFSQKRAIHRSAKEPAKRLTVSAGVTPCGSG